MVLGTAVLAAMPGLPPSSRTRLIASRLLFSRSDASFSPSSDAIWEHLACWPPRTIQGPDGSSAPLPCLRSSSHLASWRPLRHLHNMLLSCRIRSRIRADCTGTSLNSGPRTPVDRRDRGKGCPVCAGKVVVPGLNDLASRLPGLAAEWHPARNSKRPDEVTPGSHYEAWWVCGRCGNEWPARVYSRAGGKGCRKCSRKRSR